MAFVKLTDDNGNFIWVNSRSVQMISDKDGGGSELDLEDYTLVVEESPDHIAALFNESR